MNTQAGDFYLSNEDADRIAASAGLSASEYDALAKAASLEQQQRNQAAVQRDIDKKMQILANLNAASRGGLASSVETNPPPSFVPSGMSPVSQQAPVSASERFRYANQARSLQQEIQRNLSEAGMIQGPSITGPLTPTPPVGSEQPKPEAPAQPSANAPAPTQEQKQPGQFSEFASFIKKRDETRARAIDYVKNNFPREDWVDGLEMVQKMTEKYFPAPRNIAQPIIDQFTGKPLEGYALIGGKVEKIEKPKVEEDGRSVIGYEGKAPTQAEAVKFRSDAAETSEGVRALDELIQIGRKGSSLSPTDRARAQNLARMIQGRLREDIVGPGAVSNPDREVLEQVISNPLQIFTLVDIPSLLEDMKARVISGQNTKAAILGLKPIWQQQQQQSAPGGVVKAVRMPGGSLTRQ